MNVLPLAASKLTFGSLVVGPVLVVRTEPVTEGEHPLNFWGGQFRWEHVKVDVVASTGLDPADEVAVFIPTRLPRAERIPRGL